ncbi:hypothetical protein Tco_0272299 [Tanacetum coccineum]
MSQPANDNFSLHDDEELSLHDDASLDGSVPSTNKGDAPTKPLQIITTNTLSNIKLPVLQKDDYDTWAMEMEQYLEYIDNEEQFADEKERKARTLLLMAVLKDHLRRFHGMDDAKEIWAAIKTRFGVKGYDRFLKSYNSWDALGAGVSDEDANHKFLRSLPPAWDSLAMTMRTKRIFAHCRGQELVGKLHGDLIRENRMFQLPQYWAFLPGSACLKVQGRSINGFSYNALYAMYDELKSKLDEKLKKYRRIGMKAVKDKDALQKIVDSWFASSKNLWKLIDCGMSSTVKIGLGYGIQSNAEVLGYEEEISRGIFAFRETDAGYNDIPLYSRFKQVEYKGVPHPLSGDYTPREQEDIDDSLYEYGKYGPQPQSPSPTVSDTSSTVYSTCPSNDSDGELGAVSDHSVNDDPIHDHIPIPSIEQVTIATQKTQPQVPKPQQTVDPSCAQHVKTPRQPIRTPVTPSPIPSNNRQNWNQRLERDLGAGYSFERKTCFVCGSLSHLIKDCDYYEKKKAREAALKSKMVVHADVRQATPAWTNTNRVNKANQFTPRPVQLSNIRPNLSTASKTIKTGRVNVNTGHGNVNPGSVHVNSGTHIKSGSSRFNTGKQHVNSGNVHFNSGTHIKSGSSRFNTGKQNVNSGIMHVNTARVNTSVSNQNSNKTSPKLSQVNLKSPTKCFSKQSSPENRPFSRNTAHKPNKYAVKGKMGTAVKTSAGCVWRKVIPLSNTNSGPTPDSNVNDHPLKHMEHRGIFDMGYLGAHPELVTGPILKIIKNFPKRDLLLLEEVKVVSVEKICDKKLNVLFTEKECFVVSSDFKMPDENQTEEAEELLVVSSTSRKAAVSDTIAKKKSHSPKQSSSTPISNTNPVNTGSENLNTVFEEVTTGNIEDISPSDAHEEEVFSDADDDKQAEIKDIYDNSSEALEMEAGFEAMQEELLHSSINKYGLWYIYPIVAKVNSYSKTSSSQCCQEIFKYLKASQTLGLGNPQQVVVNFWTKTYLDGKSAIAHTRADGSLEIIATIDTIRYTIFEASIRDSLQFDDATGITMLPNLNLLEIFGKYEKGFSGVHPRPLLPSMLLVASNPNAGQDNAAQGQSQQSPTPPPIPTSTSPPPPIPSPTPPPIPTSTSPPPPIPSPTPPPIPTPTPPSITTPTPPPTSPPPPPPETEPTTEYTSMRATSLFHASLPNPHKNRLQVACLWMICFTQFPS